MIQKVRLAAVVVMTGMSILFTGCVSTQSVGSGQGKVIVEPVMPDYKLELTLAKLNGILSSMELTDVQRARCHYERGVIYDSVGLRLLSRIDFHQALKMQPNMADAYNFIGIYYTQEGEFENAYEAFDAVLELSPDYDDAFLNRGIALYYGERNDLAVSDMESFYSLDPQDGYRALWLYVAESANNMEQAKSNLAENSLRLNHNTWSSVLVDYYLGKKSRDEVFTAAKEELSHPKEYAERLCEAYFYIAKIAQQNGQNIDAANYFRLSLATNLYDFVEHRYARVELAKINAIISDQKVSDSSH